MVATEGFPPGHNGEGRCVCRAPQPMSGVDGIRVVENRWSVVWKPGQYTTLAPWYPLDGRLGLSHPNQPASHVSKNRELWLPFLPRLVSQSEVGTSFGQGEGCLGRGWWVLFTRGFAVHAQDVLEPLAEWFYATEYISSASLAFRDPRRWIVVD